MKIGRNDKCSCGSGKKYKKCCINKNMNVIKIKQLLLGGFSATSAEKCETFQLTVAHSAISTEPIFNVYAIQIFNIIHKRVKEETGKILIPGNINRMLLLIHKDDSATLYINDFDEIARIKASRSIKAEETVFGSDISEITHVRFPSITIEPDDKVINITRSGFIFGIYFNFSQKLQQEQLEKDLATLKKRLFFEDHLAKSKAISHSPDARIFTEGKTDVMHLKKALGKLGLQADLSIVFNESTEDFGDSNLLTACKVYAMKSNEKPIICIFDRDNEKIIKELEAKTEKGKSYQDWGNNVYSFVIPTPQHRSEEYKNICIEMYYLDKDLQIVDDSGKRLHFDNEIEKVIAPDRSITYRVVDSIDGKEFTKKISDTDAEKIINDKNNSCAISKTAFATHVVNGDKGFEKVDFSAFSSIFEIIKKILYIR